MVKKRTQKYEEIASKDVRPGMVIRIHQTIKDVNSKGEEKERIQVYEGTVIRRRGGNEAGATMTVRKISEGVGVEKIYPLTLPTIKKIDFVKQLKVRRANLGYVRHGRKTLKEAHKA